MVSAPSPAFRVSSPSRPLIRSGPVVPLILSGPAVPVSVAIRNSTLPPNGRAGALRRRPRREPVPRADHRSSGVAMQLPGELLELHAVGDEAVGAEAALLV